MARDAEQPDAMERSHRLLEPYRKRMNDLSIFTYSMLRAGVLQSILLTYPGCFKGLRLIDGDRD